MAIHEKRLKAVIPDSPIVDLYRISKAAFDPILTLLEGRSEKEAHEIFENKLAAYPVKKAFIEYQLWTWGMKGRTLEYYIHSEEVKSNGWTGKRIH